MIGYENEHDSNESKLLIEEENEEEDEDEETTAPKVLHIEIVELEHCLVCITQCHCGDSKWQPLVGKEADPRL